MRQLTKTPVVLAMLLAVTLLFAVAPAWADMGSMGSMGQASGSDSGAASQSSTAAAATEATEQLGLMPRLYKLTGSSTSGGQDSLPVEEVGAIFPNMLGIATTPSSISTGIECHMDEVCGYDPCTCGKPDAWGHCACGGFSDVAPAVSISSSDPGVAQVVQALGRTWIVPVSAGTTTVTITAELVHYRTATYAFTVDVLPFGALDALLIAAAIVLVAIVACSLVLAVRLCVRAVRRARVRRAAWAARALALKEEFPLTWREKLTSEKYAARHKGHRRVAMSTSPFVHDLAFSIRRSLPVLLAGLAVFAVLVPVSTCAVDDISVFNVNYTHEQLKYQLYAQSLGPVVNAAAALFGSVLALALFRFLLQKRSTTALFSVGLSRVKLFCARWIAGAIGIVVGIGVPFAVSLALNVAALGWYDGQLTEFFFVTCGYIVVALVSFSLAAAAVSCAGTLFEACAFACALLFSVTVVFWGIGVLSEFLLVGNAAGVSPYGQSDLVSPSLLDAFSWLNPLLFFADSGSAHQFFKALHPVYYPELGDWRIVGGWLVAALALSGAALVLFCRRRGEQAEMAGMSPAFSLVSVALAGLAAFAAVVKLLGGVDVSVALLAAFSLFVLVSLVLLLGPLRGRTSRMATLCCIGGEACAMGVVVSVVAGGAFGFASYIPETDQVASVEVSYNGSPSYLTQGFSGTSGGASYYCTSSRTYSQKSSIDIVRSLQGQFIETARDERKTDYTDFEQSVVPYDVVIRYHLEDGGEVVRYYSQASIGELSSLLSLDNDSDAHALESAVITGDTSGLDEGAVSQLSKSPSWSAYRRGSIYAADGALNKIKQVTCTDEDRAELLSALAQDLESLSAGERYNPTSQARVCLMFTLSPELDVSSFGYSFSNAVSYVTDEWESTMAWLEAHGVIDQLGGASLDSRIIEQLTFQLDDPYASINKVTQPVGRYFMAYRSETAGQFWITQDYGALKVVEDQAKIAEVLPNLRTGCYMTGGYLVQAKLRGIDAYVYFYLPSALAPSYL